MVPRGSLDRQLVSGADRGICQMPGVTWLEAGPCWNLHGRPGLDTRNQGPTMSDQTVQTKPEAELAKLIVTTLNLDMVPSAIDPEAPLFADGLGLDSIDILELALAISQTYGVQLRSDDENNATIFRSLRSLTDDIQRRRLG
jgi:acyl carrier protein